MWLDLNKKSEPKAVLSFQNGILNVKKNSSQRRELHAVTNKKYQKKRKL
jgi:hypothetical protein